MSEQQQSYIKLVEILRDQANRIENAVARKSQNLEHEPLPMCSIQFIRPEGETSEVSSFIGPFGDGEDMAYTLTHSFSAIFNYLNGLGERDEIYNFVLGLVEQGESLAVEDILTEEYYNSSTDQDKLN